MELQEARAEAKQLWRSVVLDYSDASATFGMDMTKKKLKALDKVIDEMPIEDLLVEIQENKEFIASFKIT